MGFIKKPAKRLTASERDALEGFLARPDLPERTLTYRQLQGFFFALASAPELVAPSEWMPRIFGDEEPVFADKAEVDRTMGAVMSLYNEINREVVEGRVALPPECAFQKDVMANLDAGAPVGEWCEGFRVGHLWLAEYWEDLLPEEMKDEYFACLLTLVFFTSRDTAERVVKESDNPDRNLEDSAKTFRSLFPEAMEVYAGMGRAIYQALLDSERNAGKAPAADVDRSAVARRNDPCPCGSGRKFKSCCGAKVH